MRAMRTRRGQRTAFLATCLMLVALTLPAAVAAHAQLESTAPAAGATVDVPPEVVSATFDDDLVSAKSSIEVRGPDGSTVATGGVDAEDAKTLSVAVTILAAGTYDVRWAAATEDGHLERGRFAFTVAAGAASPEPTATIASASPTTAAPAIASSVPTATPGTSSPAVASPSTPPDDAGGAQPMGQIAIIAVLGLGLGLGIGWWRSRG
jgi:methionine-rich copper-binding protein CopC